MNKWLFMLFICIFSYKVQAQNLVNGRVVDNSGKGIQSVNIYYNNKISTSDSLGYFKLNLTEGKHRISFKSIGFFSKDSILTMPLKEDLIVVLQDNIAAIEEVVINTGYQKIPKTRSTGSFGIIENKDLYLQVESNLIHKLEGLVSGYNIDRKTNGAGGYGIMIRGLSTIRGSRSPLIILDNFPYEGDISNLDPNEVENITILKDAAAASIWGAKAGNGVIVISTKKSGFNNPLKVNVSANSKINQVPDLFYKPRISSSDMVDVENYLFDLGYYKSLESNIAQTPLSEVVETRIAQRDGIITTQVANAIIENLRSFDLRNEINDKVFRTPISQQYAFDISKGNNVSNWMLFGGFNNQIDELNNGNQKFNIRYANNFKLGSNVRIGSKIHYTIGNLSQGLPNVIDLNVSSGILPLYTRLYDEAGNQLPVLRNYRKKYLDGLSNKGLLDWNYYPLSENNNIDYSNKTREFIGNLNVDFKLSNDLNLNASYQFSNQVGLIKNFYSEQSYFTRDLINRFTQIDGNGLIKYVIPKGEIRDFSSNDSERHNLRSQLNFDKEFGRHNISALVGGEVSMADLESTSSRFYGVNSESLNLVNVDYVNAYKTFVNGSNAFIPNGNSLGGLNNRSISLYFNGAYTFNNKYTFSVSARRDAANTFGLKINDKWNPLFSSGFSWLASNEQFYKIDVLPYLRFRGTFGSSGNTDPSMSAVTTIIYSSVASPYTLSPQANFFNFQNPQLHWEKVYMFNLGLDFGFKNNVIKGSVEYFKKKSVDLFSLTELDYTSGIGNSIVKNAGIIGANGIDLEIVSNNLKGKLKWETYLNFSLSKDNVIKNYLANRSGRNFLTGNLSYTAIEGYPVYGLYSYKWAGLDPKTGNPQGYKDGLVSQDYAALTGNAVTVDDLKFHGAAFPKLFGSVGNNFSLYGLSLNFRLSYKFGYYFRKPSLSYTSLFSMRDGHGEYESRWQKPGDELFTNVPSNIYPANSNRDSFYAGSEVNVLKGDHIRIQYVNLSYNFPGKKFNQLLKNTNVFIVASNLGIIWRANKYGIDPDYKDIPISKSFAVGINGRF